jgi:predicted nucleic acid-binding protein
VSAVFDTSIVADYLRGAKPAASAFKRFPHRAITVTTWVEIMAEAPAALSLETREFLRTFERLAISEAISDRALTLLEKHSGLKLRHAIPWATAVANELIYITCDLPPEWGDKSLWVPYRK